MTASLDLTRSPAHTPLEIYRFRDGLYAVDLIAAAMTKAGTTAGPKLRDAIAATKNFPGVTGQTTIDEKRNSAKAAVMLTVKNGRSLFFESVTP